MTGHRESLADHTLRTIERTLGPAPAREARRALSALDEHNFADDPAELAALWEWLEERGETPTEGPAYFMEKGHKWTSEYRQMIKEQRETGVVR
jgi:hypothetical protein